MRRFSWAFVFVPCSLGLACGRPDTAFVKGPEAPVVADVRPLGCEAGGNAIDRARGLATTGKLAEAIATLDAAEPACAAQAAALRSTLATELAALGTVEVGQRELDAAIVARRAGDDAEALRRFTRARIAFERAEGATAEVVGFEPDDHPETSAKGRFVMTRTAIIERATGRAFATLGTSTRFLDDAESRVLFVGGNDSDGFSWAIVDVVANRTIAKGESESDPEITRDRSRIRVVTKTEVALVDVRSGARTFLGDATDIVKNVFPTEREYGNYDVVETDGGGFVWATHGPDRDVVHVSTSSSRVDFKAPKGTIATMALSKTRVAVATNEGHIAAFSFDGAQKLAADTLPMADIAAVAVSDDGAMLAWTTGRDAEAVGSDGSRRHTHGKDVSCGSARTLRVASSTTLEGEAVDGDIGCTLSFDLKSGKVAAYNIWSPGTYYEEEQADGKLCAKLHGSCEEGSMLVKSGDERVVPTASGFLVANAKQKRIVRRYESETTGCAKPPIWIDRAEMGCIDDDGKVRVISRQTGTAAWIGPPMTDEKATFPSAADARAALRCKIGAALHPFELCEDLASAQARITPPAEPQD